MVTQITSSDAVSRYIVMAHELIEVIGSSHPRRHTMTATNPRFGPRQGQWRKHGHRPPFGPDFMMGTDGPPPPPPFDGPVDDEQPGPGRGRRGRRGGPPFGPGFGPGMPPGFARRFGGPAAGGAGARPAVTSAPPCSRWSPSSPGTATRSSRRSPSGRVGPGGPAPARSTPRSRSWRTRASSASSRPTAAGSSTSPRRAPATSRSTAPSSTRCGTSVDRGDDDATALFEQLGQLHAAAQQVISAGTPAQITAATEALTEARKTIYRLLAE